MLTKVYHCSLSNIEEFDFTKGVHFGGFHSALGAALRHVYPERWNIDTIYIHECLLDVPSDVLKEDDLGSNEAWQKYADNYLRDTNIGVLQYVNRYEPDVNPSYYVINSYLITIKKVRKMRPYEAQAEVDAFLNYDY